MEGRIKFAFLSEDSKNKNTPIPVVLMNCKVKAGDHVVNKDGLIATVNQSTQIFYDEKIVRIIHTPLGVKDNEKVTLSWDCKGGESCEYPFCGSYVMCFGRVDEPRINEYEQREY